MGGLLVAFLILVILVLAVVVSSSSLRDGGLLYAGRFDADEQDVFSQEY